MTSTVLLVNALLILALMLSVWGLSVLWKNVAIVDLFWGLGFVLVAWASVCTGFLLVTKSPDLSSGLWQTPSRGLLPIMVSLWGLRLSTYLAWRNLGEPEDKRYAAMRQARGPGFWWQSLFIVFLLQGVIMWIVSLPVQLGIVNAQPGWTLWHVAGLVLWGTGLFFEAVGDWQLALFRKNPQNRGRVLQTGLWRYTRHPNYFGDFCVWWGFYAIAVAHGQNLWTIIGPASMSFFLMKVSGVTLLERSLTAEKPGYADYIQRTNAFFPGPPRKA